jgi:esterase/lipase
VSIYKNSNQSNKKCIIYLHTYSGNKTEGTFLFDYLPKNTDLVLFDFIGSGNSDEGYITYGLKEKFDIANILKAVDSENDYEEFYLWGRSMGAVIAIHFADHFLSNKTQVKSAENEQFMYKAIYINRNGKTYKKMKKIKINNENVKKSEITEDEQKIFNKVSAMILDSPFTNLRVMLQGRLIICFFLIS